MTMNERELIQKTLKGEEEAFEILVQKNRPSVYRHCLSIVKDEEIAQDLTQETFVHAFQHLASFKMKARFSTWLWRIAHNLSLNYIKKQHYIEREFREELLPPLPIPCVEHNEEQMLKIQEALIQLPPKQRIVFEMYELKRIPQKQIAAELEISHGTVRSRLYYARRKMRQLLQPLSKKK